MGCSSSADALTLPESPRVGQVSELRSLGKKLVVRSPAKLLDEVFVDDETSVPGPLYESMLFHAAGRQIGGSHVEVFDAAGNRKLRRRRTEAVGFATSKFLPGDTVRITGCIDQVEAMTTGMVGTVHRVTFVAGGNRYRLNGAEHLGWFEEVELEPASDGTGNNAPDAGIAKIKFPEACPTQSARSASKQSCASASTMAAYSATSTPSSGSWHPEAFAAGSD